MGSCQKILQNVWDRFELKQRQKFKYWLEVIFWTYFWPDILNFFSDQTFEIQLDSWQKISAFYNFNQLVQRVFHFGFAESDDQPIKNSLINSSIIFSIITFWWRLTLFLLFIPIFKGPFKHNQNVDNRLAIYVSWIDKYCFVLLFHRFQSFLLWISHCFYMFIQRIWSFLLPTLDFLQI